MRLERWKVKFRYYCWHPFDRVTFLPSWLTDRCLQMFFRAHFIIFIKIFPWLDQWKCFPFLTAGTVHLLWQSCGRCYGRSRQSGCWMPAGRSNLTQSVIEAGGHGSILKHKTHLVLIAVWSEAMGFICLAFAALHSIEDEDVFPANSCGSAWPWRRPEITQHYDTVKPKNPTHLQQSPKVPTSTLTWAWTNTSAVVSSGLFRSASTQNTLYWWNPFLFRLANCFMNYCSN